MTAKEFDGALDAVVMAAQFNKLGGITQALLLIARLLFDATKVFVDECQEGGAFPPQR